MKKIKLSAISVCVFIFVFCLGFSASAKNGETYTYKDLTYTVLDNGTVQTVRYDGDSKKYVLPSKIDGKSVTVIGTNTFVSCRELESLTIPGSVKQLQDLAIAYCPKLTSLTIKQGSLKEIDTMSIYSCRALKTVSLPKNISSFSNMYDCDKVEKVTFNSKNPYFKSYDGVVYTKDEETLVYYPPGKKTTHFIVPSSVTTITRTAFNGAKNLKGVYIPKTVKEIGETAFGYTSVTIYYEGSKIPQNLEAAFYPWEVVLNSPALKQVQNVKASSVSASAFTLKWEKVDGATGYRVYIYNAKEKEYEAFATTTKNTCKVTELSAGTAYKIAVKAYVKTLSGNVWTEEAAKLTVRTAPETPTFTVSSNGGKVTLKWDKVSAATGYVIYVAESKNGTYKKLATTKKLNYSNSGLNEDKTYYFKIRAYTKSGNSNIYSSYSAVKGVKIK